MNGARTTFMRRGYLLTALSALLLLAASAGTALAQGTVTIDSLTLSSPTVNEGGEATATLKFTVAVAAGDSAEAVSNGAATVGFGFSSENLATSPAATKAGLGHFIGLTTDAGQSTTMVRGINVPVGGKRSYTATRTFGLNDDLDAEHQQFQLIGNVIGSADVGDDPNSDNPVPTGHYTIVDDETQEYTLSIRSPQNTIDEGTASSGDDNDLTDVLLVANPRRTDAAAVPTFTVTGPRGFFTGSGTAGVLDENAIGTALGGSGNQGAPSTPRDIGNISVAASDKNRTDDTMTLMLHTGGVGSSEVVDTLDITVVDIHKLPAADAITAEAFDSNAPNAKKVTEITEGGDPVYVEITVDRGSNTLRNKTTTEPLTISIGAGAAQAGDFEVEPARVTLGENTARGKDVVATKVKLTALSDDDVGMEDLMLNLVVSGAQGSPEGSSTGTFSIAVVDKTEPKIWALPEDEAYPAITGAMEEAAGDDGFNPGESFMVAGSDLFGSMDGYMARYSVSASGDDAVDVSVSPTTVTVTATKAGTSKIKVTATAEMGSSFKAEQDMSDEASIMFEVTVVDKMLMLTLEAPGAMEGNVVEGMDYDVTVTANRAVHDDTEVTFMRSDMSEADVRDYSIEGVTIMAGEMMATATLMVTEDMTEDAGHAMGEALHLYAMAGDTMSNTLELTIWDEAVPALPLIGQLLLALFLMAGGARLYRRRQS